MPGFCYILHSSSLNRFYIGATQDSIENRIEKHNLHSHGNHRFTAATNDWELYLLISVSDYSHAIRIERKIKSMKSSSYIRNLEKYPEMLEKLITQTSI